MIIFTGPTSNHIYYNAIRACVEDKTPFVNSRCGMVKSIGIACFELPDDDRLIFLNRRDINPFFALIEAAWVLSGRNDLEPLLSGIGSFGKYSDDGLTLNGAYGHRLRTRFGIDQISTAITELTKNSASRRVVLSLYAPEDLSLSSSKDIPCNTHVYLRVVGGKLDITVLNRSNDVFHGIPYNFVVFRVLQEFVARSIGLPCGVQRHVTNCLHLYEEQVDVARSIVEENTPSGISAASHFLKRFSYSEVVTFHKEIASLQFENLSQPYRRILESFKPSSVMATHAPPITCSSNDKIDTLVYIADKWFNRYRRRGVAFPDEDHRMYIQETLRMKSCYDTIKGLPLLEVDDALSLVEKMSDLCVGSYDQIFAKWKEELTVGVAALPITSQLAFIILSMALSTVDPYTVTTEFGRQRQTRLLSVAQRMGLPPSLSVISEEVVEEVATVMDACL